MQFLDTAEKKMHYALNFEGRNPMAAVARRMLRFITKNGPQTTTELLVEFFDDVNALQLNDVLNHLITVGKIYFTEHKKWELKARKDIENNGTTESSQP